MLHYLSTNFLTINCSVLSWDSTGAVKVAFLAVIFFTRFIKTSISSFCNVHRIQRQLWFSFDILLLLHSTLRLLPTLALLRLSQQRFQSSLSLSWSITTITLHVTTSFNLIYINFNIDTIPQLTFLALFSLYCDHLRIQLIQPYREARHLWSRSHLRSVLCTIIWSCFGHSLAPLFVSWFLFSPLGIIYSLRSINRCTIFISRILSCCYTPFYSRWGRGHNVECINLLPAASVLHSCLWQLASFWHFDLVKLENRL